MEKKTNIKILVCCHKPGEWISDDIYMPIHCGKAISNYNLDIQGDDVGDNISEKNIQYCELTAMYWAWKNLKDVDYVGFCHYRRHFDMENIKMNTEDYYLKCMKNYDVILVKPIIHPFSNMNYLNFVLPKEDIYIAFDCLKRIYPSYINTLVDYMYNTNKWIAFNMFICSWSIFNEYQKWLFPLLHEIEHSIKMSGYSRLKRVVAYLSEILLPVFMFHNGYKIKYLGLEESKTDFFSNIQRQIRFNFIFKLYHPFNIETVIIEDAVKIGLIQDGYSSELFKVI